MFELDEDKVFDPEMSLSEAKELLMEKRWEGVVCPCCERVAKVNPMPIGYSCAVLLMRLCALDTAKGSIYFHKRDICKNLKDGIIMSCGSGSFASLRHWGLIKELSIERYDQLKEDGKIDDVIYNAEEKRRSGYWLLTPHGKDFVLGKSKVPRHALVYNSECLKFDESSKVGIIDCFKNTEDYAKAVGRYM